MTPIHRSLPVGLALSLALALTAACSPGDHETAGSGGAAGSDAGPPPPPANTEPTIVEDLQGRMYDVKVPSSYDGVTPAPLVVMLHQAWKTPDAPYAMDEYLHITPEAEERGAIVAIPFGTLDPVLGQYVWNATDSCCGADIPDVNDVGYIMAMVNRVRTQYRIDDKRIFLIGQSNGSFLAHRLACDRSSLFAGVVTLTGATYKNPDKCAAIAPVAVLHYHGDQDAIIPFAGGPPYGIAAFPPAPGAEETVRIWAGKDRCQPEPDRSQPALDLVPELEGAETSRVIYTGCQKNGAAELRSVHGGQHTPLFDGEAWANEAFDFLMTHPKP
jgi:polyhydroxybutyrate depolymerase